MTQTTTLQIIQLNSLGHEIEMRIPDVVRFKEINPCNHIYVQGTHVFDDETRVGPVICIKCGNIKK